MTFKEGKAALWPTAGGTDMCEAPASCVDIHWCPHRGLCKRALNAPLVPPPTEDTP